MSSLNLLYKTNFMFVFTGQLIIPLVGAAMHTIISDFLAWLDDKQILYMHTDQVDHVELLLLY